MGKSRYGDKEYTREQRLIHENQGLKREVAQLRKRLARIELDNYERVEKTITEHYQTDNPEEGQRMLKKVKDEWICWTCKTGHLEMTIYNKLGSTYYFRACNCCSNRTKSQKYSTDVKK